MARAGQDTGVNGGSDVRMRPGAFCSIRIVYGESHRVGVREENIGKGQFGGSAVAGRKGDRRSIPKSNVELGTEEGKPYT